MNDIYNQDRMNRNSSDFGGSGAGNGYYNAKEDRKERLREIRLPLILSVLVIVCLAAALFLTIRDISYVNSGTSVECPITSGRNHAQFRAPDGNSYSIEIGWAHINDSDADVTVYYKGTDYSNALIPTSIGAWVAVYGFFLLIAAAIAFWIYKILHKTSHSAAAATDNTKHKFDE